MREFEDKGRRRAQRRQNLVVVGVLAALMLGLVALIWLGGRDDGSIRMASTPLVRIMVLDAQGDEHHFEAQVTLALRGNARVGSHALNTAVARALSEISFEDIISADGMAIMRAHVYERLSGGLLDEGDIFGVFLTDVLHTFSNPAFGRRAEFRLGE